VVGVRRRPLSQMVSCDADVVKFKLAAARGGWSVEQNLAMIGDVVSLPSCRVNDMEQSSDSCLPALVKHTDNTRH